MITRRQTSARRHSRRLPLVACSRRALPYGRQRQHILAVLTQTQFDKKEAARRLGINLASLYRKIGEHAIQSGGSYFGETPP